MSTVYSMHSLANSTIQEKILVKTRMALEGRNDRAPYTKKKFAKIFKSWHIYLLTLLYM